MMVLKRMRFPLMVALCMFALLSASSLLVKADCDCEGKPQVCGEDGKTHECDCEHDDDDDSSGWTCDEEGPCPECASNPCEDAECPSVPDAVCETNPCNCKAKFVLECFDGTDFTYRDLTNKCRKKRIRSCGGSFTEAHEDDDDEGGDSEPDDARENEDREDDDGEDADDDGRDEDDGEEDD